MTGIEAATLAVGKVVAKRAGQEWLAARSDQKDRGRDLTGLIRVSFPDRFIQRSLTRQLDAIADTVEQRLSPLIEQEYRGLDDNDRVAVLAEVVVALEQTDLSDKALFALDADPVRLAQAIRTRVPASPDLGEAGGRLYEVVVDECCDCLVRVVQGLTQFVPRAATELLSRLSGLADQVSLVLDRLPVRTLDASEGTDADAEFERRYREHLARTLDQIELFGVPNLNYQARATLSIAYISLTVTDQGSRDVLDPLKAATLTGEPRHEHAPATTQVEAMLTRSPRTLLRGQAGSGKSTLLRWIAVTAARSAFTGRLESWNGRVPILVKLRSHAEVPLPDSSGLVDGPLAAIMPAGWVHRVLDSGRGVLLVDGVDEVPYGRRDTVRQWLRGLLDMYPGTRTIVTSRPAAADVRWLTAEGFRPVILEPMSPDNLHALVRQWHQAVLHAGSLPCPAEELPAYQGTLLSRLESGPHLRALATTPLLAAMLCALNLDRVTHLPTNRMELYRAVLDMLLEHRDTWRSIPGPAGVRLEREHKERLLQELGWRLTFLGRAEMSKATATRRIGARIAGMPRVAGTAEEVLDHLLQRSGLIREPVPGRIDFVHRTVQEYLAAEQAADDADTETLILKGHLDQWRDTVVMAAGHGNAPFRAELLKGLMDRADTDPKHGRRLRTLVAACLETIPDLPAVLRDRIDRCIAKVIPPRNAAEARHLARAGEEVLRQLPTSVHDLPPIKAAAVIRTAWLVNGDKAMAVLARYAEDPRWAVQRELIDAWDYFDPHIYASRVLADAPLDSGGLIVENPALLPAVQKLRHLTDLYVRLPTERGLELLAGVKALKRVAARKVRPDAVPLLTEHPDIDLLDLEIDGALTDDTPLRALRTLRHLRSLFIRARRFPDGLGFVAELTPLRSLLLHGLEGIEDFSPIAHNPELRYLSVSSCSGLTNLAALGTQNDLSSLHLLGSQLGPDGCAQISARFPGLTSLTVSDNSWVESLNELTGLSLQELFLWRCVQLVDIAAVGSFTDLTRLDLPGVPLVSAAPLSSLRKLRTLILDESSAGIDLAPLSDLSSLVDLALRGTHDVDVTPLSDLKHLTIRLYEGQHAKGIDRLHRSTRIIWHARQG